MMKLYRSSHDRKLTGLCGGLAEAFHLDATLLRLVVAVSAFFSAGVVIPLYLIASWVIPKDVDHLHFAGWNGHSGAVSADKWGHGPVGWDGAGHGKTMGPWGKSSGGSVLDEMMDGLEKKAMENEIRMLREKLKKYEEEDNKSKGEE